MPATETEPIVDDQATATALEAMAADAPPAEPEATAPTSESPEPEPEHPAPTEEPEATEPTETEADDRKPLFSPDQQKILNERIGKEVAKTKAAQEKTAQLEADLATARQQADTNVAAVAESIGVMPEYLQAGDEKILKQSQEHEQFENWALEHWDGYDDGTGKTFTAQQIRTRYGEIRRQHDQIAGRAQTIRDRARTMMQQDLQAGRRMRQTREQAERMAKAKKPAVGGLVTPAPTPPAKKETRGVSVERVERAGGTLDAVARELAKMAG
jgi:hypothetical protein